MYYWLFWDFKILHNMKRYIFNLLSGKIHELPPLCYILIFFLQKQYVNNSIKKIFWARCWGKLQHYRVWSKVSLKPTWITEWSSVLTQLPHETIISKANTLNYFFSLLMVVCFKTPMFGSVRDLVICFMYPCIVLGLKAWV